MGKISVGILGATGAIGEMYRKLLSSHSHFQVRFMSASKQKIGDSLDGMGLQSVEDISKAKQLGVELVFSCLDTETALTMEPLWGETSLVISSSSAFRDRDRLILPEINGGKVIGRSKGIFAKSNCTLHPIALILKELIAFEIVHTTATTLQAVSGAGRQGLAAMDILDNVIPFIEGEEEKIQEELHLLFDQNIPLNITCCRVPVYDGHMVSLEVQLKKPFILDEISHALKKAPWIEILEEKDRPQPRLDKDRGNGMHVCVGRMRKGANNTVQLVALAHNRVRGAAGTGIKIAEIAYGFTQPGA